MTATAPRRQYAPERITPVPPISGFTEPGFEAVRAAFEENFRSRGETSASVCVYKDGRPVVDLWGGSWQQDSVGLVFSATKGLTAVAALMLVESGRLEVDAPVAQYWPEFAAAGKQRVTVRQLLCHQAGLVGFSRVMMMKDMRAWDPLIADLGAQAPGWEPGSGFGYHALTFGWLVGEVIRRITGLKPGEYLRKHVCEPNDLDIWIGLPPEERHRFAPIEQNFDRTEEEDYGYSELIPEMFKFLPASAQTPGGQRLAQKISRSPLRRLQEAGTVSQLKKNGDRYSDTQRAFLTFFGTLDDLNTPGGQNFEMPAGNGICSARSMAKFYALVTGQTGAPPLISPGLIDQARTQQATGIDRVLLSERAWGLGFMLPEQTHVGVWKPTAFGHYGNGGATGMTDPESGFSFGYVPKRVTPMSNPRRPSALIKAVYESI
jgi:CubicO group peptidase (beta-lactamase class C family)